MSEVSKKIAGFIGGRFLIHKDATKNWLIVGYGFFLLMVMIASSHSIDRKVIEIAILHKEIRELRAIFVDKRSLLVKVRLESNIIESLQGLGLYPLDDQPYKIVVRK